MNDTEIGNWSGKMKTFICSTPASGESVKITVKKHSVSFGEIEIYSDE